jgi:hypothetical protein
MVSWQRINDLIEIGAFVLGYAFNCISERNLIHYSVSVRIKEELKRDSDLPPNN